jgi:DNA polymerase III subunit delta
VNSPGAYLYVLYGEDTFTRDERVASLKERMRALVAGEHNLTVLEGADATVAGLRQVADAAPFLAERRMVVVHGLIGRLQGRGARRRAGAARRSPRAAGPPAVRGRPAQAAEAPTDEYGELLAYLPRVPEATSIIFVEDAGIDAKAVAGAMPRGRGLVREFPRPRDVAGWIRGQAKLVELELDEGAVRLLAQLGGDDLRRLDGELRKLAAYAAGARVTRADVQELVVGRDVAIWALLDALAERRRERALEALRRLYGQGEPPEALLTRDIGPLFRRLLLAKELDLLPAAERGRVDPAALGLNPRTLDRLAEQAAAFEREELEGALEVLLDLERRIKTGETEPEPALELVLVKLCA